MTTKRKVSYFPVLTAGFLTSLLITATSTVIAAQSSLAEYPGQIWNPLGSSVSTATSSSNLFAIIDDAYMPATGSVIYAEDYLSWSRSASFHIEQKGDGWSISNGLETLALTESPYFLVARSYYGAANFWQIDSTIEALGANNWKVRFSDGSETVIAGVAPVPVPPAVLLFGSALVGLVAIGRRKMTVLKGP